MQAPLAAGERRRSATGGRDKCRQAPELADEVKSFAPVAQLDRALASGAKGHRFESCRVRQLQGFLSARCRLASNVEQFRCGAQAPANSLLKSCQGKSEQVARCVDSVLLVAELKTAPAAPFSAPPILPMHNGRSTTRADYSRDASRLLKKGGPWQRKRSNPRRPADGLVIVKAYTNLFECYNKRLDPVGLTPLVL